MSALCQNRRRFSADDYEGAPADWIWHLPRQAGLGWRDSFAFACRKNRGHATGTRHNHPDVDVVIYHSFKENWGLLLLGENRSLHDRITVGLSSICV